MDLAAIRNLSETELKAQVQQSAEQLFRIRFQKSMGNLEGLKNLKAHKLEIAQLHTVQRERELAAAHEASPVVKQKAPAASQRTERKKAKKA